MQQPQPGQISLSDFLQWEQKQADRYEWIDGVVTRCAGGTDEHAAIIANLTAYLHGAVGSGPCFVRGADRKLIPRNEDGIDLGSFYADLFVSCAPEDRRGAAAHFPTVVIEVLSSHVGAEFTRKRDAYLGSARLADYLIVDSTRRAVVRYAWAPKADGRQLITAEYRRGPVPIPSLGLTLSFEDIYAGIVVPAILHPIQSDEEDTPIQLD